MAFAIPMTVWERAARCEGWLTMGEADLLWRLCEAPWCEVGSYEGRSAFVMANRATPGWCIDRFEEVEGEHRAPREETLRALLSPYDVEIIARDFSLASADVPEELRFLHLDANHSYEATADAFRLYAPKVRRGGYLVMHDVWNEGWHYDPRVKLRSAWPEVTRFVMDEMLCNQGWEHIEDVERSAAFRKR